MLTVLIGDRASDLVEGVFSFFTTPGVKVCAPSPVNMGDKSLFDNYHQVIIPNFGDGLTYEEQIEAVIALAKVVHKGLHVVITTQSLAVLYAINNHIKAYTSLGNDDFFSSKYPLDARLSPDEVDCIHCNNAYDGTQIEEGIVGKALDDLIADYSKMAVYEFQRKNHEQNEN